MVTPDTATDAPPVPHVLSCGYHGVLVELPGGEQVTAWCAALRAARPDWLVELVPAARTLLIRIDPTRISLAGLRDVLGQPPSVEHLTRRGGDAPPADELAQAPEATELPDVPDVVVPVRYDGVDLAEVAEATGLTRAQVVERHQAGHYTVAFCGFAPGFGYLTGLDPRLRLPRRATPRTSVPAGSVALADRYTGVYPRPSPGGWWVIGTTELTVWDVRRDPPALLRPGTRVRFESVSP